MKGRSPAGLAALSGILMLGEVAGCGGRAELPSPERRAALPVLAQNIECLSDTDCLEENACLPAHCRDQQCVIVPRICDDEDPCTLDECLPDSGECQATPVTPDEDDDGFRRPLPGMLPGQAGACGNDCDDTSPFARPGGEELCDGVDNDCDGIVDNGSLYTPTQRAPLLLSVGVESASPAALTYSTQAAAYGAVYTHRQGGSDNRFARLGSGAVGVVSNDSVSQINSDTFAGDLTWTGSVFATAWESRKDGDYEIYFKRLSADGEILGPDTRVSDGVDFSLRPSLVFNGEYLIVWEDHRDFRQPRIYAQRLSAGGELIGSNRAITPPEILATGPVLAQGGRRLGMVFGYETDNAGYGIAFRSFDQLLEDPGEIVPLPVVNAAGGSIVYNGQGRFVVSWYTEGSAPGPAIYGAVLSETGEFLVQPRALTEPAQFARFHTLLPLGDRLLVLYSEFRDGRYNIRSRELDDGLVPLGASVAVTDFPNDAYAPVAAFGPNEVGVLFSAQDSVGSGAMAYFTQLACEAPVDVP